MKGVIYCYHCILTGKKYIGKTKNEYQRRKRHEYNVRKGHLSKFYSAVRKYGWKRFVYGIIEEVNFDNLNEKEIFYISKYNSYEYGYNMTIGGDGNNVPGELCRIRSKEALLGKSRSNETKQKIRESLLGKIRPEEVKRKLRAANLGKKWSKELRERVSNQKKGQKGTPHTEETKKRLSILAKKRNTGKKWWNDGHINKFMIECPGDNWIPGRVPTIKMYSDLYKICTTCNHKKLSSEFYVRDKKTGRRNSTCKECNKAKYKKSKKKND